MDLKIKGRTAVITGGDSGMGLATAKILASEGVNIVLSDKTHEELEKAAEEVRGHAKDGGSVIAVTADVTNNEEVLQLAARVKEEFGGLTCWCTAQVFGVQPAIFSRSAMKTGTNPLTSI